MLLCTGVRQIVVAPETKQILNRKQNMALTSLSVVYGKS